jgi:hypothetical protein
LAAPIVSPDRYWGAARRRPLPVSRSMLGSLTTPWVEYCVSEGSAENVAYNVRQVHDGT